MNQIEKLIAKYKGYQEWSGAQGQGGLTYGEVIEDLKSIPNIESRLTQVIKKRDYAEMCYTNAWEEMKQAKEALERLEELAKNWDFSSFPGHPGHDYAKRLRSIIAYAKEAAKGGAG